MSWDEQGGQQGGNGSAPGNAGESTRPKWWSSSIDLDLDADSNNDGVISGDADVTAVHVLDEDLKEDSDDNPYGAIVSMGAPSKVILRGIKLAGCPAGTVTISQERTPPLPGQQSAFLKGAVLLNLENGDAVTEETNLWDKIHGGGVEQQDLPIVLTPIAPGMVTLKAKYTSITDPTLVFEDTVRLTVFLVALIPAVDLNGEQAGRGKLPDVPINASIPAALGGVGDIGKMRIGVRIYGPAGGYRVELSTSKGVGAEFSVEGNKFLGVAVPASGIGESSLGEGVLLKAKGINYNAGDFCYIKADVVSAPDALGCQHAAFGGDFLKVYRIVANITPDEHEFSCTPKHVFNVPTCVGDLIDMLRKQKPHFYKILPNDVPEGSKQRGATNQFPDGAYNVGSRSSVVSNGIVTLGTATKVSDDPNSPLDFLAGIQIAHKFHVTCKSIPEGVGGSAKANCNLKIRRAITANGRAFDGSGIPPGAGVEVAFGAVSVGTGISSGRAIAASNHEFYTSDTSGVWTPALTPAITGHDSYIEANWATDTVMTKEYEYLAEVSGSWRLVLNQGSFSVMSTSATASHRVSGRLWLAWADSFMGVSEPSASVVSAELENY